MPTVVNTTPRTAPMPDFAYRDIDYFFRKKRFFGPKTERNVTAIFHSRPALDRAVKELQASDFRNDDIFIALSHKGTVLDLPLRIVSIAPFVVPAGIVLGLVLGGLLGWAAQAGWLQFMGIAPFLNGSALESASASGSVGGFIGGILGLVYGMRIPEYRPWKFETTMPEGTLFLVVRTVNPAETELAQRVLSPLMEKNSAPVVSEALAA